MDAQQALKELEKAGTAQNRKVYEQHGVKEPLFGVSYAALRKLHKEIKTDHELARELWKSGNHDARLLATMIADGARATEEELAAWARDLDNYVLTDAFSTLAARSVHAGELMKAWMASKEEWIATAGWNVLQQRLVSGEKVAAAECQKLLDTIERTIHGAQNRVRYAMNGALIGIGCLGGALETLAIAAARRIGPVDVDHGETGCETPDAASYIAKVRDYRGRKAQTRSRSAR